MIRRGMAMPKSERHARVVVEFVGLPGSGKSTVCHRVKALLAQAGMAASTTADFVAWSASLGKAYKLWLMLRSPLRTVCHLVRGVRFWLSLDRRTSASLRRVLLAPMIARSLERFLESESAPLALLDQAGVQGVWSIGALARDWDREALAGLLRSAAADASRLYVCLTADAAFASRNIAARSGGDSRFDALAAPQTEEALHVAQPLMTGIFRWIEARGGNVLVLDAAADVEAKARAVAEQVRNLYKLPGLAA